MRLICPNCGAQYEVDPDVIPETGRDVQCSNCGHGWFQTAPDSDAGLAAEMGQTLRDEALEAPPPAPPPADDIEPATAEPEPEPAAAPPADPELDPELAGIEPEAAPAEAVKPARPSRARRLDPDVANVLRAEAAREAAARRAEASAIETQPELGIDAPPISAEAVVDPDLVEDAEIAEIADADGSAPAKPAPAGRGSRRELLPDIDEINSTLRPTDAPDRAEDTAPAATVPPSRAERRRKGARIGFLLAVATAAAAVAVYYFAPELVRLVPSMAPYLEDYTAWVNELRPQINESIDNSIAQVQALISSVTGGGEDAPAN